MFLRVEPCDPNDDVFDDVLAVAPADVSQPWRWAAQRYSSATPAVHPSGFYPGRTAAEAVERALAAERLRPLD